MAQTHLKSFNGRQGGILQSISGVSGASGGLKTPKPQNPKTPRDY